MSSVKCSSLLCLSLAVPLKAILNRLEAHRAHGTEPLAVATGSGLKKSGVVLLFALRVLRPVG